MTPVYPGPQVIPLRVSYALGSVPRVGPHRDYRKTPPESALMRSTGPLTRQITRATSVSPAQRQPPDRCRRPGLDAPSPERPRGAPPPLRLASSAPALARARRSAAPTQPPAADTRRSDEAGAPLRQEPHA